MRDPRAGTTGARHLTLDLDGVLRDVGAHTELAGRHYEPGHADMVPGPAARCDLLLTGAEIRVVRSSIMLAEESLLA